MFTKLRFTRTGACRILTTWRSPLKGNPDGFNTAWALGLPSACWLPAPLLWWPGPVSLIHARRLSNSATNKSASFLPVWIPASKTACRTRLPPRSFLRSSWATESYAKIRICSRVTLLRCCVPIRHSRGPVTAMPWAISRALIVLPTVPYKSAKPVLDKTRRTPACGKSTMSRRPTTTIRAMKNSTAPPGRSGSWYGLVP